MTDIPWDEMPEGTTHWVVSNWHKKQDDIWFYWESGPLRGWSRSSCQNADVFFQAIPVPPKPHWLGPEDGFPPIGLRCEVGPCRKSCTIVGSHPLRGGVVYEVVAAESFGWTDNPRIFHKIPTKRDQWVEKVTQTAKEAAGHEYGLLELRVISAIHDALLSGELPPPEQE